MQRDLATTPIVFDLETCGLANAAEFLEPVQAARNLKDPEKIKADIEQRTAERDGKLALDWNTGRIVALAWWTEEDGMVPFVCKDDFEERHAIKAFWRAAQNRTLIGFNCKSFDLRYLIQRSRYLDIPHPWVDLGRYSSKGVTDLYLELTFADPYTEGAMRRTLKHFCKRFGIPVADEIEGKDIADLVNLGDWAAVEAHCVSDVALTVALARRLRFVAPAVPVEAEMVL